MKPQKNKIRKNNNKISKIMIKVLSTLLFRLHKVTSPILDILLYWTEMFM